MSDSPRCPQCGGELPADAPEGLCPECLLKARLETEASAPSGPEPEPGARSLGHFIPPSPAELAPLFPQLEILELLGHGGMGAVYKARQPGLDRLVALKILPREVGADPAFAERFTREARALAKLSHPNIVAVYDFGQVPLSPTGRGAGDQSPLSPVGRGVGGEGPLYYFVMEYVDGLDLRRMLRAGQLQPRGALAIVPQVCEALQFAHDEGIVHRDIKPENILVDKRGRVKIADFGLAKLLRTVSSTGVSPVPGGPGVSPVDKPFTLTGTGQVMGTWSYMAPEQLEHPQTVDHRADIYSLGVVFYEMLTGELPIGRFAPPSQKVQVDVRLDEVVLRALEKEPERRYQHASEVKSDVESISRSPAPSKRGPGIADQAAEGASAPEDQLERVVLGLLPHRKIAAIKMYRKATGAGLREAKDAVEAIARKHGIPEIPVPFVWRISTLLVSALLLGCVCAVAVMMDIEEAANLAQLVWLIWVLIWIGQRRHWTPSPPNHKMVAIKMYRKATGAGLREATDAIEAIAREHGIPEIPVPLVWRLSTLLVSLPLLALGCHAAYLMGAPPYAVGLAPLMLWIWVVIWIQQRLRLARLRRTGFSPMPTTPKTQEPRDDAGASQRR